METQQQVRIRMAPPPPPKNCLFQHSDGSKLNKMKVSQLIRFEIWHGNRILDTSHKEKIQKETEDNIKVLDSKPYHIVTYTEDTEEGPKPKTVIVDGQHRVSILLERFQSDSSVEDFDVLVVEKFCRNEKDVIEYFKLLNKIKAIPWKEDPKLIINNYIQALLDAFPKTEKVLFRPGRCQRPFVSLDKLREEALKRRLGQGKDDSIEEFIEKITAYNEEKLETLQIKENRDKLEDKAVELGFTLGLDLQYSWLSL